MNYEEFRSGAFSIVCDGKVIDAAPNFTTACQVAKAKSLIPGSVVRTKDGQRIEGRIVSVWTLSAGTKICKHASFACGWCW